LHVVSRTGQSVYGCIELHGDRKGPRVGIRTNDAFSACELFNARLQSLLVFSEVIVGGSNRTVAGTASDITFATNNAANVLQLQDVSMGVFEQALSNVAFLRAQNGGGVSRLSFAGESLALQEANVRAAVGRIEDVDIAEESANLAKYSILTQAAAAMVAQANTSNDVALMLLR
jgi:flagellin